ncbi:acetoacetyl-CoA synthetase [Caerostris darwini]|uniref:Acetoacetyl-CoA synthetase n=1 Tax=Caerostris darwini TaxID=1538125 RepID=A0AAV4SYT7_9ARAC|nr:acetoacetyl-CoA synthetase [Caerostris darwini]
MIIFQWFRLQVFLKTGPGFLDNEWFSGARLNFAENLLKIRDNRIALICADEHGNEETVTYAEMFEEVQEYAAAFRKQGVTVGDRVTCAPNLKKVVVVASKRQTVYRLSEINKSILLEDFLLNGRTDDGKIPDITFEQLPFNHPTAINFTSGTTGIPKGVVHSAGSFIAQLRDFGIHYNLKSGDTIYTYCPVGWSVWDDPIPSLALGVTLILFNGSPQYRWTLWDCLSTSWMNFDSLKIILLEAAPSKQRNFEFLLNNVKKDLFIASSYGATEVFGNFSGFDLRRPALSSECQAPALGVDLQVFDDHGVWRQSDEGWINPRTKGIVVIGRSDDTIKQDGERFCAGDIYFGIDGMEELQDYICVGQTRWDSDSRAVLFVKLKKDYKFTPELRAKIVETIKREVSFDYVPKLILDILDIPYNLNRKRLERVVKIILETNTIPEVQNIRNP